MTRAVWNRKQAHSLRHAMELCVNYAKTELNRSVEQIAELMGEASHFTLYKWMESGRMPSIRVKPFEHACGIDFVTRFNGQSAGYLMVRMPQGRKVKHRDVNELSRYAHEVLGMVMDFYDTHESPDEAIAGLSQLMEDLAFQRGNIEKHRQPELLLGDE
ncbi:hypothetical protein [Neptunomonas sp.]|uniref:hypothetical protein n=1 Tax=Neptunomonas sp. TaxID=1971898 RepID=UPI0025CD3994|nr:hypothetical protein [Neptunomonas sp.]